MEVWQSIFLVDIGSSTVKVYSYNGRKLSQLFSQSIAFKQGFDPKLGLAKEPKRQLFTLLGDLASQYPRAAIYTYVTALFRKFEPKAQEALQKECLAKTDVVLNIISQEQENGYLETALVGKYTGPETILIINIGGGSTELIFVKQGKVVERANIDLGVGTVNTQFPAINHTLAGVSSSQAMAYIKTSLPKLRQAARVAIYSGGELTYMQLTGYALTANKQFIDEDHPSQIAIRNFAERNEAIFSKISLHELESLMPENPTWMHGARGCSAIAQAICEAYGVETVIPSNANLINGVIRRDFASSGSRINRRVEISQPRQTFTCLLHGSFRKHFSEIKRVAKVFSAAGIEVIAPKLSASADQIDGFRFLEGEQAQDPRYIELVYLHHLKQLGENGFSYFVNPEGYIGKTVSYELGIAQVTNVPTLFMARPKDHPVYTHANSIWDPQALASYVVANQQLPIPHVGRNEVMIHKLWADLMTTGSVIAVGGIIEYKPPRSNETQVLFVKTHKWGSRYSVVGGKIKRNERLREGLQREVREQTGLRSIIGAHLCTFDRIKNSGYYVQGIHQVFVDNVINVTSKRVTLNEEAQDYIWLPPQEALKTLPLEPNAKFTLKQYLSVLIW